MGRHSTGAVSTKEATRLELTFLIKAGLIEKGKSISCPLSWSNNNKIGFKSTYSESELSIQLNYDHTSRGLKQSLDYKIDLVTVPSNLGKGEVLYFVCPITGQRCRILYLCYGSPLFKSRKAYNNRIYYSDQLSSKLEKPNYIYWKLERKLERMDLKYHKPFYKGKPTRKEIKIRELKEKRDYYDKLRFSFDYLPSALKKTYHLHNGSFEKMLMF